MENGKEIIGLNDILYPLWHIIATVLTKFYIHIVNIRKLTFLMMFSMRIIHTNSKFLMMGENYFHSKFTLKDVCLKL